LKNMKSGEQIKIGLKEILKEIKLWFIEHVT
jgi:hypothetical protein